MPASQGASTTVASPRTTRRCLASAVAAELVAAENASPASRSASKPSSRGWMDDMTVSLVWIDRCSLRPGAGRAIRAITYPRAESYYQPPCPSSPWSSSARPAASASSTSSRACSTSASSSSAAPVDDQVANLIVAQLLHLESQDPDKDISIYINSPGGSIYAGLAIYDTMQFIKPDVATMCVGIAMSMGSLLLTGGAKGKRMSLPNSRASSSTSRRPASRASRRTSRSTRREILKTRKRVDEIYAQAHRAARGGRPHATWSATASSPPSRPSSTA